jgi:hypothetical protein
MIQFAALFAGSALTAQLLNPGQVGSLHGWWSVFSGTGSLRDTGAGASTPSGVSLRAPGVATGTWAVTQLDDMSGNGRHFIQGTAANQPILNQVTLVNGVPPVKFDGVDDFMKTAAFTAISQPFTVWLAGKKRTNNSTHLWAGSDSTHQANIFGSGGNLDAGTTGSILTGPTIDSNSFDYAAFFSGASSSVIFRNGTAFTGNAGTQTPLGWTVGARYDPVGYGDLDLYEAAVFTRALTATEVLQLRAYAKAAYLIT